MKYRICPRCKKNECERIDDEYEMYCEVCNDILAEKYKEQKEFEYYHSNDSE